MAKGLKVTLIFLVSIFSLISFSCAEATGSGPINCRYLFLVEHKLTLAPDRSGYIIWFIDHSPSVIKYADPPLFYRFFPYIQTPYGVFHNVDALVIPSHLVGGYLLGEFIEHRAMIEARWGESVQFRPLFPPHIECIGWDFAYDLQFGYLFPRYDVGQPVPQDTRMYSGVYGRVSVYRTFHAGVPVRCPPGQFYSLEHRSCRPCEVPPPGICQIFGENCVYIDKPVRYHFSYAPDCSKVVGNKGYVSFTHSFSYEGLPLDTPCKSSPTVLLKYNYYDFAQGKWKWSEGFDISNWPAAMLDLGFVYKFVYSYTLPDGSVIVNETEPFTFFCCAAALDLSSFEEFLSVLRTSFPISLLFWANNFLTFDESGLEPIALLNFPYFGDIVLQYPDLSFFRLLLLLYLIFSIVRYFLTFVL